VAEKTTKTTKKSSDPLDFEERVVAFVDILGFRDQLKKSENLEVFYELITELKQIKDSENKRTSASFSALKGQISQFSDCILISYYTKPKKNTPYGDSPLFYALWRLAMDISLIARKIAKKGFVIRGGIAIGKTFHDDQSQMIVGKSFIDAYEIETQQAVYPRVVISEDLIQQLQKESSSLQDLENISCIKLDKFDQSYVIDFIGYTRYKHGQEKRYEDYIRNLNEITKEALNNSGTPIKIKKKYHYLKNLLEQLDDYGDDED
jgi:hypothetical protein